MDSLIDFNSPKLRREDLPLIPGNFLGSMSHPFPVSGEESNPFDMVVCQVAANAAAENDPFEMVLHDAINCQVVNKMDLNIARENSCPKLDKERVRKSISLPDLRPSASDSNSRAQETEHIGSECVAPEQCFQDTFHSVPQNDYFQSETVNNHDSAGWNYLEDIPPPDSLLNATVDMSCFLDDTLSANISSKQIVQHPLPSGLPENQLSFVDSLGLEEPSKANVKSEEQIVLLAQKKIENIISKATLAVQNDIQDSIIQRRLSSQLLTPSQEALSFCTPKRSKETRSRPSIEPSLSVQEWSRNEIMKLNIVLPEPPKKSIVSQDFESDIDKICNSFMNDEANISSEEMPTGDLSFSSPLKQVISPKQKEGKILPSGAESLMKSPDLSSSPSLLPLPLCEDAVRNLSLCSKYSPSKGSTHQNKSSLGVAQSTHSSTLEQTGKQTKLFLRKSVVPSKTSSKMAPMKATAPVQNMTRAKSSLITSAKLDINNAVSSIARKSVSKMPQSPRCAMSGSLPNLSTHGSKAPSRLPSPRRSVAPVQEPLNMMMKRHTENRREKSTNQISTSTAPLHSSPRPIRKGSLSNKSGRVLADVNTSCSTRMTPKYKNIHSDSPRRGRSIVTEKENFL